MAINIKNDEAQRLTRELTALTGESVTTAVTVAVRERLDRVRRADTDMSAGARASRALALAEQIRQRIGPGDLSVETLYDEATGLPV